MKIKIGIFLTLKPLIFAENEPILFSVVFLAPKIRIYYFRRLLFLPPKISLILGLRWPEKLNQSRRNGLFLAGFCRKNEPNYYSVARGYFPCTIVQFMSSMEFHHFYVSNFKWPTEADSWAAKSERARAALNPVKERRVLSSHSRGGQCLTGKL
jgi:hypothetical protein